MNAINGVRVMLVACLVFVALGWYGLYDALRMIGTAVPVEATVIDHRVRRSGTARSDDRTYTPVVTFRFQYEKATVTASNVFPGYQQSYGSGMVARLELSEWPIGSRVTAFVPPDEPTEAFLRKVPSGASLVMLFVPIAVLVASVMYLVQVDRLYVHERRALFCVALPFVFLAVLGGASLAWTTFVDGQGAAKIALWIASLVLTSAIPLWTHMANSGELVDIAPDDPG